MLKVTVLYNLPEKGDASDLDTQKSAFGVAEGLRRYYDIARLGIKNDDIKKIKNLKTDFVFNLVEWAGKNYKLGIEVINELEKTRLPYSGSNAWGFELSSNKKIMKKEMDKQSIKTPKWFVVDQLGSFPVIQLNYPVIIKPVAEHCGIGIGQDSICNNNQEIRNKIQTIIKLK